MKRATEQTRTTLFAAAGAVLTALVLTFGLCLALRWDLPLARWAMSLWQDGQAKHEAGAFSLWYVWTVCADALAGLPAWSVLLFDGLILFSAGGRGGKGAPAKLIVGAALALGGGVVIGCEVFRPLAAQGALRLPVVLRVVIGLLCGVTVLAQPLLRDFSADRLARGKVLAVLWSAFSLGQLLLVQLLKKLWGRLRFDDMTAAGQPSAFTPWTQRAGAGGSSFPSGHTAAAGVLLVLVLCCRLYEFARRDVVGWLFAGYLWTLAVGFGRMLAGRHFLSDVLAAAWIDSLLLLLLVLLQPRMERLFRVQLPETGKSGFGGTGDDTAQGGAAGKAADA